MNTIYRNQSFSPTKRLLGMAALFTFCFACTAQAQYAFSEADPAGATTEARWDVFSQNIVEALGSGHEGLQQGALRMIIQYGDRVDVEAGRADIQRIYRDHGNDNLRRMAVVALGKMQDERAIRFLAASMETERDRGVRQTMQAVVAEYQLAQREQQAEKESWTARYDRAQ